MLTKGNSGCEIIPPLKDENNQLIFTNQEKANTLNDYFSSISTIDEKHANLPNYVQKCNDSIEEINLIKQDVLDALSNLEFNKASGPDKISHKLLKECRFSLCKPLLKLFNKSIRENKYPQVWEEASVMPLFKKGDESCPSNYRPISLISCVGKVMECIMFKYTYNHLHKNDLIYKKQSGFLRGHSTVYQLVDIYN